MVIALQSGCCTATVSVYTVRVSVIPTVASRCRHRHLVVLRGSPSQTSQRVEQAVAHWEPGRILWVTANDGERPYTHVEPREVARMLGRSFDAVVIDAHEGIDAEVLGIGHGLVWGGGVLALRLPPRGQGPSAGHQQRLAAVPFCAADVGTRFFDRVVDRLDHPDAARPGRWPVVDHEVAGHPEQRRVVERLGEIWRSPGPSRTVLTADRGRGKSSALGLAIAALPTLEPEVEPAVAVTAGHPDAVREVLRFGTGATFIPLADLLDPSGPSPRWVIVDEAAQIPVPVLEALVARHGAAHLTFCTTTHGYEGTGRGFSLRFCAWLNRQDLPVHTLTIDEPIRWSAGDPVERAVFDALLLDATPDSLPSPRVEAEVAPPPVVARCFDRDELAAHPTRLRALFGLLVQAHYRTTPGDLHRLLDAPNLSVHGLLEHDRVVGATIVAREGGLSPERVEAMASGATRIRAHALPDALVAHLGLTEAGAWPMARSVRIATHPDRRRRGYARRLVEHVHQHHDDVALWGTIFGATPQVIAFRRSLGYSLVRVSASRGARTGEPSVLMVRPCAAAATQAVPRWCAALARDLPRQLQLLDADGPLPLSCALRRALLAGLPQPAPLPLGEAIALVERYAHGPRTFESIAPALLSVVGAHPQAVAQLDAVARQLIDHRVVEALGWRAVARAVDLSVPAAMRALRRAARALIERLGEP